MPEEQPTQQQGAQQAQPEMSLNDFLRKKAHEQYLNLTDQQTPGNYRLFLVVLGELWRVIKRALPEARQRWVDEKFKDMPQTDKSLPANAISRASELFDVVYEAMDEAGYGTRPSPLSKAKLDEEYNSIRVVGSEN
jgi:hypothetical protein